MHHKSPDNKSSPNSRVIEYREATLCCVRVSDQGYDQTCDKGYLNKIRIIYREDLKREGREQENGIETANEQRFKPVDGQEV